MMQSWTVAEAGTLLRASMFACAWGEGSHYVRPMKWGATENIPTAANTPERGIRPWLKPFSSRAEFAGLKPSASTVPFTPCRFRRVAYAARISSSTSLLARRDEIDVSTVLKMTYSTGMKNRFSTVENNMPPTIAVPTE